MAGSAQTGKGIVALTGGTGFIGGAVLRWLLARGWRVRALYRPRAGRVPAASPGLEWIEGSLGDAAALARLVSGVAAVIHCAGAVRGATRAAFDGVNEAGVRAIVAATVHGSPSARLLLVSSLAAREPQLSDYAASKRRGEMALQAAGADLAWTIVRPSAVYGPGDRELLPLFRHMARGYAPVPGRGAGRLSLLYVDDLAAAVAAWLAADVATHETFELDDGTPGGYGWDDLLRTAASVLRRGAALRRVPIPGWLLAVVGACNVGAARVFGYAPMLTRGKVRELLHPDWVADGGPFARATGWRPVHPFAEGLARTLGRDGPARGN